MKIKDKKCKICNTVFTPKTTLQMYCSYRCSYLAQRKKAKKVLSNKKRIKLNADKEWAKLVKERDNYRCVYCGSSENLNSHHIFSRNNKSVRLDIDNGITLCAKHHTFSNEFSAHRTPTDFTYWLEKLKGKKFMEDLAEKARKLNI